MTLSIRIVLLFFLTLALGTNCFSQNFTVKNYHVEIYIKEAGYFDVVEHYDIEFNVYKHGIYRNIETRYDVLTAHEEMEDRRIVISNVEVPGHQFEASGKFSQKVENMASIKIGNPDKTIIGPVHYEVRYRVANAFLFQQEQTQFYWNIKPPDWHEPFSNITFQIKLPEGVDVSENDVFVYTGSVGTTTPNKVFNLAISETSITGSSQSGFISNYGEAVTILVNLPPDAVKEIKPLWPFWTKYGWTLILGLLALVFYYLFNKYGKDEPAPAIISYFPPEGIDPAMAGFLINDEDDTSDLISLLPYWGANGLIEIEEVENEGWFSKNDTRLVKLKGLSPDAPAYQKTIFNGLFGSGKVVLVSSLKDKFYETMNTAKKELKVAAQKFYEPKARKAHIYIMVGIILTFVILLPLFFYLWNMWIVFVGIGFCGLLLLLNRYMVKKNPRGIRMYSELKGFKEFIKVAETNRLKMLLAENPSYFEQTMAYALTFGAFDRWADKFSGLNIPPPGWYHSSSVHNNQFNHFSNSFNSTINSASSTMVSTPSSSSSSGGGSSGGGFGGGGGGSW